MNDVFVRYRDDLPCTVRGMVIMDENSDYNVYINARLSYDEQKKAMRHELTHIKNGDFDNGIPVEIAEKGAKRK